ncbi:hypothetical protein [Brevibacillus sp. DP1.3A]|uniref:hypothetical protein n=1 Tax=Brevibacillus sp. DP1.3A TaxID=2738867 RepID=UPI00156A868A|nr:hypothetical protein [Brevibacillus sp. DP1.3A]UED76215.1 hypothetical protein HP399_006900 [Brevibacillus sp. DP1.3A]
MISTGFVQKHEAKGQEPVFFLLKSTIISARAKSLIMQLRNIIVAVGKLTGNVR